MWFRLITWLASKLRGSAKVELAEILLVQVQEGPKYGISNARAEKILETVVKSAHNKIYDFILKD